MGSDELREVVRGFFVRDGWTIADGAGDEAAVRAVVVTESGRWGLVVWVTDDDRIVVHSLLPFDVPADRTDDVVRLIGRLNDGMILGAFELDHAERTIRFRTSTGVRGVEPTDALLRELVYPNVATVDEYLPEIDAALAGPAA